MAPQHPTFHRFDPETCHSTAPRRGLAASLLVGFIAGALSVSVGAVPARELGETFASVVTPSAPRLAFSSEWRGAQRAVGFDGFVRVRPR